MSEPFSFVVDGAPVTVWADPKTPALGILRDHLGIRGCKAGCSPQGMCGCCTVLIEGKPRLTCTLPVKGLAGKAVTTLDGLPAGELDPLADSFVRAGATQCGYCTPGIVLSAWALLQADACPGPEAITRALSPHVCRCTGYTSIATAITDAAALRRGEVRRGEEGAPTIRPEGREIVLGDRPYVDDLVRPGMWVGAVVLGPLARGTLVVVDLEGARAMPDVHAIGLLGAGDVVGHPGEIVAAVAAEDAAALRKAVAAVRIEMVAADTAPEEREVARARRVDGDVATAFEACAHVVEETFTFAATDPVFLEPEAALAVPVRSDEGVDALVVYSQGHDAAAEARALSAELGVPVRVLLVPSGGSYGGKEERTVQLAAARLALASGRPVRVAASLEQGMRLHRRRPGARVRVRLGCDAAGRGLVVEVQAQFHGGADAAGADRVVAQALGALPYAACALVIEASVAVGNGAATGPIRGAGGIPVCAAVEQCLDRLAASANLDPFVLRMRNLEGEGAAVLGALAGAWHDAAPAARGLGVGRVDGSGGARVVLTVQEGGTIEVMCNVPELGQGRDTSILAALMAATGRPAVSFLFAFGDSAVVGPGAPATSPVEVAAERAGRALAHAISPVGAARVEGARFVGEQPERAPPGWAANLAILSPEGALRALHTAVTAGPDARLAQNLAEGASHMGVGVALSEEVAEVAGMPEGRFRMLGLLKAKGSPALTVHAVPTPAAREVAEVAILGVPGAIANAVAAAEGRARTHLPMKDTDAARAVGVRAARPVG